MKKSPGKHADEDLKTLVAMIHPRSPEIVEVLFKCLTSETASWADRLRAANQLLDRGYGRPHQSAEVTGDVGGLVVYMPQLDDGEA